MPKRFNSHLKDHVIELHRNKYIHSNDPAYFGKVLKYMTPSSAERHFRLALEWEHRGSYAKALFHYIEVIRLKSVHFEEAQRAARRLDEMLTTGSPPLPKPKTSAASGMWTRVFLITFMLVPFAIIGFLLLGFLIDS